MRSALICILIAASFGAAADAAAPRGNGAREARPALSAKRIQSCDAHRFETIVHDVVDGQPHESKVKLCGVEGQTDSEWIDTLRDAVSKLQANKDMPAGQREQIITAITSEIARLSIVAAAPVMPTRNRPVSAPATPLSRDYATLPPLPLPGESSVGAAGRGSQGELTNPASPPATADQPPAAASPTVRATSLATSRAAVLSAPSRLRFGCDTPGDLSSDAPCAEFQRDTTITIHAAENIPAGTMLQFLRNDEPKAELAIDGLRRGGSVRVALPPKVCAGFTSGKLDLRIVRDDGAGAPEPLSTEGPYSLRC
jgi:hypothetical protein